MIFHYWKMAHYILTLLNSKIFFFFEKIRNLFGITDFLLYLYVILFNRTQNTSTMTLQQIKDAIANGKTVCWSSELYVVIKNGGNEDYLIKCTSNNHYIGLYWLDGDVVRMNGKESDFFILGSKEN